jgi:hypothetical protein
VTRVIAILALLASSCATNPATIRQVDFRNFAYTPACTFTHDGRPETILASHGVYRRHHLDFTVRQVAIGDLTGDGRDEAVVVTRCNTGGTCWCTEGFVYGLKHGVPTLLARIEGGDRAYGGIVAVRIVKGRLQVDRYGTTGGYCCPEWVETTTYRLEGRRLVEDGKRSRRPHTGGW